MSKDNKKDINIYWRYNCTQYKDFGNIWPEDFDVYHIGILIIYDGNNKIMDGTYKDWDNSNNDTDISRFEDDNYERENIVILDNENEIVDDGDRIIQKEINTVYDEEKKLKKDNNHNKKRKDLFSSKKNTSTKNIDSQ